MADLTTAGKQRVAAWLGAVRGTGAVGSLAAGREQWSAQAWQPQTSYAVGTEVSFGGRVYRCRQAHMSQADWTRRARRTLERPSHSHPATVRRLGAALQRDSEPRPCLRRGAPSHGAWRLMWTRDGLGGWASLATRRHPLCQGRDAGSAVTPASQGRSCCSQGRGGGRSGCLGGVREPRPPATAVIFIVRRSTRHARPPGVVGEWDLSPGQPASSRTGRAGSR